MALNLVSPHDTSSQKWLYFTFQAYTLNSHVHWNIVQSLSSLFLLKNIKVGIYMQLCFSHLTFFLLFNTILYSQSIYIYSVNTLDLSWTTPASSAIIFLSDWSFILYNYLNTQIRFLYGQVTPTHSPMFSRWSEKYIRSAQL